MKFTFFQDAKMAAAAILKLGRNRIIGLRDLVRMGLYCIRTNFHEVVQYTGTLKCRPLFSNA